MSYYFKIRSLLFYLGIILFTISCKQTNIIIKENKILMVIKDNNFDELEYIIVKSRLKAIGFTIDVANTSGNKIIGINGLEIIPDLMIKNVLKSEYCSLILISSQETAVFEDKDDELLKKMIIDFNNSKKIIGAHFLTPLILAEAGLLNKKKVSCWPTISGKLTMNGALSSNNVIEITGNIITGMGGSDENNTIFTMKYIELLLKSLYVHKLFLPRQPQNIEFQLDESNTHFVMTHNQKTRTGELYVPSTYDGKKKFSLVFGLHGTGGTGKGFREGKGFEQIASELNFIMVFPDGYNKDWNPVPGRKTNVDDTVFFSSLIDILLKKYNIDPARVYFTGHSLGAFMTYRLAYELSGKITAIAPVAGLVYTPQQMKNYKPKPVSILHLHAIDDWLVPFFGDGLYKDPLDVMSSLAFWRDINTINGDGKKIYVRNKIEETIWSNPDNKTDTGIIVYPHGGHTWLPLATEYISEFFYNHPDRGNSVKIDYTLLSDFHEIGKEIKIDTIVQYPDHVKQIAFYKDSEKLGDDTNAPFTYNWIPDKEGKYRLSLEATLDSGKIIHSTNNVEIWVTRYNVALNANVTSLTNEDKVNLAENVIDGNIFTRWSSVYNDPQWILIDIHKIKKITGVTIIWETAYATNYEIQTSVDNSNWTTVYTTSTGSGSTDLISFVPIDARYIRMYGKKRATEWGYSIWEFLVHSK